MADNRAGLLAIADNLFTEDAVSFGYQLGGEGPCVLVMSK